MIENKDKNITEGVNSDEYSAIFDFNKQDADKTLKELSVFSRLMRKVKHNKHPKSNLGSDDALFKNIIDNETKHTK